MANPSSLFVLLIKLSELLLLPDFAIFPCENLCSTVVNLSSLYLCRSISDGLTFESNEFDLPPSFLLKNVVVEPDESVTFDAIDDGDGGVAVVLDSADGDGGVSVIITGASTGAPIRRATFGGGLKQKKNYIGT